jgi:hypothetical protein
MIKVYFIQLHRRAVIIFQMASGKYWLCKYENYVTRELTPRNAVSYQNLGGAINAAKLFINQSVPAQSKPNNQ